MKFISRLAEPRYIIQSEGYDYVTVNGATREIRKPAKRLLFRRIGFGSIPTAALPMRHGKQEAYGILNTESKKQRPGMTQEEAERELFAHPKYGIDFVAIGEDGTAMTSDDQWIKPLDKGYYCALCDQQIKKQGLHPHVTGKKHKDLMSAKETEVQDKLEEVAV
jgi:hypothetical protein